MHTAFEPHVAAMAAVVPGPVGGGVGHDLAEPGGELPLACAAELGEIAVSRKASVLHKVGVIKLGLQQPVGFEPGQQSQIGPVYVEQLASGVIAASFAHEEGRAGMDAFIEKRPPPKH